MLDKIKTYLLRYYINNKLIYHKQLRYTHTDNNKHIFADLTIKGNFISININEYPIHKWTESNSEHIIEVCIS